jgi:hypothetical protein
VGRNPKIKLRIKTDKQLDKIIDCCICGKKDRYRNMFFYVDESNISITDNSKPLCKDCKNLNNNKMIITKEHQEALIENYRKKGRNEFECMGFVEGLNEMLNLIDKKIKQKQNESTLSNKN